MKIEDSEANRPSRKILVAWITPAKGETFNLLMDANELVPFPRRSATNDSCVISV